MRLFDFGLIVLLFIGGVGAVTLHESVGKKDFYMKDTYCEQKTKYPAKGVPIGKPGGPDNKCLNKEVK